MFPPQQGRQPQQTAQTGVATGFPLQPQDSSDTGIGAQQPIRLGAGLGQKIHLPPAVVAAMA